MQQRSWPDVILATSKTSVCGTSSLRQGLVFNLQVHSAKHLTCVPDRREIWTSGNAIPLVRAEYRKSGVPFLSLLSSFLQSSGSMSLAFKTFEYSNSYLMALWCFGIRQVLFGRMPAWHSKKPFASHPFQLNLLPC